MQVFNKVLAVFLEILFMVSAVLALFLFNLEQRAFSPETYKQAFADEDFYNRLPLLLAEALYPVTTGQTGLPLAISGLSVPQWEAYLRAILPPDVLKGMGDEALNSIFAYLDQQSDTASLSLIPLKTNMASAASVQAIFSLLSLQPPCTLEQLTNMTLLMMQSQQIAFCNPPPELQPLLAPFLQSQLQATTTVLPDTVVIMSPSGQTGWNDPRERLSLIRTFMQFSPLVALGIFAVFTLVIVFSFRNWMDWLGIPILIIGFFASVIALIGGPIVSLLLQQILARNMPAFFPPIFLDYAGDLAAAMTAQFLEPVLWQGLVITVLGFGMLVLSFIFKRSGRLF